MIRRLLWIGDNRHPEFQEAWSWANQTAQCHFRQSLDSAISEPARSITRIVIARSERIPFPESQFSDLLRAYPLARFATLLGSLCEGEHRTGTPWPMCQRIYWHRWADQLVDWCDEGREKMTDATVQHRSGCVGVVCSRSWICEGIVESLRYVNIATVLITPQQLGIAGPYSNLLWDDSVITDASSWQALQSSIAPHCGDARHHWLASAPRIEIWNALRSHGFHALHSKPLNLDSITNQLS